MKARITGIRFDRVGRNEGCCCDRCGQYIRNIWTVDFSTGQRIAFGIDCFEKVYKAGLSAYGTKEFKKLLKHIEKTKEGYERWQNMTKEEYRAKGGTWGVLPEIDDPDSAFYGWTFEQYKEWMLTEFYARRFEENQKELERFKKCGFEI